MAVRSGPARSFPVAAAAGSLQALEDRVLERRAAGGSADTGLLALVSYDLGSPARPGDPAGELPGLVLIEVDASLRFPPGGSPRLTARHETPDGPALREIVDEVCEPAGEEDRVRSAPTRRRAWTSLPRERYLGGVRRLQQHIRAGDVYQANLTQRFAVEHGTDPLELYARLVARTPAPRSALVVGSGWALLSASPETFLTVDAAGRVETRPIKGTRARGASAGEDRAAAERLLASEKDRAELIMITDLERNDLGRICVPGSVRVPQPVGLESFAEVHHLVSRVVGRLRDDVGPAELLRATFPGGSITGAPKIRAMELLGELEPVGRNFYTGSLIWFGDDGSVDSSILIRTIVVDGRRAYVGAGGGIVADSDPVAEWEESNHKARAMTEVLGFEPEEAR